MSRLAKRVLLESLGWLMVIGGVAALILPGPGLLLILGGLVLLSQQYEWAERRLEPVQVRAWKTAADSVETNVRVVGSALGSLLLIAAGVLWCLTPDVPSWWSPSEKLWLPGGIGTGISLLLSGVIALVLVAYSFKRFRVDGEQPPTAAEVHDKNALD